MGSFTSPGIGTRLKGPVAFSVFSERDTRMKFSNNCVEVLCTGKAITVDLTPV